ncbi:MAG: terminase TerL endonuclease subunit [Sulfuritalea sp.]|nr:terminase TerL endonuclease subunit [Sulfuritalea sp.]
MGSHPVKRDYVAIAVAYAEEAVADTRRLKFGKWVRLAAKRFLADFERAKADSPPFVFSRWHAVDACEFIEKLPHVEGRWDPPTIVLHPAHVFFVVNVFGFRTTDGSARRFNTALLAIARKNAKSLTAASILLYCMCCEDEPGAQVISAATTGDQARKVFDPAKRMVEKTPDLREAFGLEPFANSIARWQTGGSFKPINAKASTQDGLNPSHIVLDEVHAQKTHDLLNVLQSAAGARANALWLYTTTEGYENPGPWPELRRFAQQLLEGIFEADHFFAVIYALDDEEGERGKPGFMQADEDFDESKWIKANPLIEVNPILLQKIREAAIEAKRMPGRHAEFKIKRLNRQSSTAKGWIRFENWKACAKAVDLAFLKPYPCWGALDLASTTDLASFRLLWNIGGHYYTWGRRWVSEKAVAHRTVRGTVPYAAWVGAGLLEVTPGEVIDHDVIEEAILDAKAQYALRSIHYDRWNADQIVKNLKKAGVEMVEFIQGAKSYNPAMKAFERAYLSGKLSYGADPVLTWCASNVVVRYDANLNMAPDKQRSADKIDDLVALLMSFGGAVGALGEGDIDEWLKDPVLVA